MFRSVVDRENLVRVRLTIDLRINPINKQMISSNRSTVETVPCFDPLQMAKPKFYFGKSRVCCRALALDRVGMLHNFECIHTVVNR